MSFFSYIIPVEWPLRVIIIAMIILAGFTVWRCLRIRRIAEANIEAIQKARNTDVLVQCDKYNHEQALASFEQQCGIDDQTRPVLEHIKTILIAGLQSSRLDSNLLVKNTTDKIFKGEDFIKTSISLFLLMGILGTLFGLAISITNLGSELGKSISDISAGSFGENFQLLRGAFAPSMWGVFFTICFVFLYSWFIQEKCINHLTDILTITTIKEWLPKLYPTEFQKSENSIEKLKTTIRNAEGINKGVLDLQNNLNESNETIKALGKTASVVSQASNQFANSAKKFEAVDNVYKMLLKTNQTFGESVQDLVNRAERSRQAGIKEFTEVSRQSQEAFREEIKELEERLTETQSQSLRLLTVEFTKANEKFHDTLGRLNNYGEKTLQGLNEFREQYDIRVQQQIESMEMYKQESSAYTAKFVDACEDILKALSNNAETNKSLKADFAKITAELAKASDALAAQEHELVKAVTEPITKALGDIAVMNHKIIEEVTNVNTTLSQSMGKIEKAILDNAKASKSTKETLERLSREQQEINLAIAKQLGADTSRIKKNTQENNKRGGFLRLSISEMIVIIIALLLLVSVITQVLMVNKMGHLEEQQVQTTKQVQMLQPKEKETDKKADNNAGQAATEAAQPAPAAPAADKQ